jgi:hypothetical protein
MPVRGVQHDPYTDIANIRTALKGYGTGFPIAKELIQNAEDAGASYIHLGWHPGLATHENVHPLLKVPALCMVNDGPFEEKHREAICRLGLGTKAGDKQAIGRFGLGLKSVFHLSEAFFFMASDPLDGGLVRSLDLFSPWHPDSHKEWDINIDAVQDIIHEVIKDLLPAKPKPWFALWLPLRTQALCGNVEAIVKEWPGEDSKPSETINDLFRDELGDTLSLLKCLNEILYSIWQDGAWHLRYRLNVDNSSHRRQFPEKVTSNCYLSGLVHAQFQGNADTKTVFAGVEGWSNEGLFRDLKESESWPQVVGIDKDGADPGCADKAEPHFSIILTKRSEDRPGKLRIKWAVFLPIGNDAYDEISLSHMQADVTIILHGYFFLNSDRTGIDGLEDDFRKADGICREWNSRLALQGTICEVLPAVSQFASRCGLDHSDVVDLTLALQGSKLVSRFNEALCKDYQWAFLLNSGGGEWKCIDAGESLYGLPMPLDKDIALPFYIFPSLDRVTDKFHLTFNDENQQNFPLISATGVDKLPLVVLRNIFADINPNSANNNAAVMYLLRVLERNLEVLGDPEIYRSIYKIPLFSGYSVRSRIQERYSLHEISTLCEAFTIFYGSSEDEIVNSLQMTCTGSDIVILPSDAFLQRSILSVFSIPDVTRHSVAEAIMNAKVLGTVEARKVVAGYLLTDLAEENSLRRLAVRYLLHGVPTNRTDESILYMPSTDAANTTWNRVFHIVMNSTGQLWRILDSQFNAEFSPHLDMICGLQRIALASACDLLRKTHLEGVDFSVLDSSDMRRIMLDISDDELLRNLPIHQRAGGGLVRIGYSSFLQSDFCPEESSRVQWEELLQRAVVIENFDDPVLLAKQRSLIPELDSNAAIKLSLSTEMPSKYAPIIMAGLSKGTPPREVWQLVRETAWLPLRNGTSIAPEDVIHIEGAEEEIDRILSQEADGRRSILALDAWIPEHQGIKTLKQAFPKADIALDHLGIILSKKAEMSTGSSCIEGLGDLEEFIVVFSETQPDIMPINRLLKALKANSHLNSLQQVYEHLLRHINGSVESDRMMNVLLHLSAQHEKYTDIAQKRLYRKWFDRYLLISVTEGSIKEIIQELDFLNQAGKWTPSTRLAAPSEGITKREQIDVDQMNILRPLIYPEEINVDLAERGEIDTLNNIPDVEESFEIIKKYLSRLERNVPREIIGALVAILGNYVPLREWAEMLLGRFSLETVRRAMLADLQGNPDAYIDKIDFLAEIVSGNSVEVKSIAGSPFNATISDSPTSLLFGDGYTAYWSDRHWYKIRFLEINNLNVLPPDELENLIKRSAESIICHVYLDHRKPSNLNRLWEELRETTQKSIFTAQLYLLNSGDFYVRQLGGDHNPTLRENLRKWDRARNLEAEAESSAFANQRDAAAENCRKLKRNAREELRNLLADDDEVHLFLVNAVRDKLTNYQYDISSIPFELFQNADDAYQEALALGVDVGSDCRRFSVYAEKDALTFIHWGRPINEYHGSLSPEIGISRGFDRDLEKMLTMSFSEKNIADAQLSQGTQGVTGKFGLGFKSVFFASSSPRVISGRLNFHIRAGFYPQRLDSPEEQLLKEKLSLWNPELSGVGTAIKLPLTKSVTDHVLERFRDLLWLLLAFARQIKTCTIKSDKAELVVSWDEQQVKGTESCFVGTNNASNRNAFLVLRPFGGDVKIKQSAILFQLGRQGFERLDGTIPSVWITAPTQEETNSGFAVNAAFDPDVGRSSLANNSKNNLAICRDLGVEAGHMFAELFHAADMNWNEVAINLRLINDTSFNDFWLSLWNLMSSRALLLAQRKQPGSAENVLYSIMWGNESAGYAKLISECKALPSGLWGSYDMLLSVPDIQFYVSGLLDTEQFFEQIASWDSFLTQYSPGSIVSDKGVYQYLCQTLGETAFDHCQKVTLAEAIARELAGAHDVSSVSAERIGSIINREFYKQLSDGELTGAIEKTALVDLLGKLKFKSKSGIFRPACELIISKKLSGQIDNEEIMRAQFAPADCVISGEYTDTGIGLFIICRENMSAPAETLGIWAKGAPDRGQLSAVFHYLLKGSLNRALAKQLGEPWLRSEMVSNDFKSLSIYDQQELKILFRVDIIFVEQPSPPLAPPPLMQPARRVATLEQIYDWWTINRQSRLRSYEKEIYPDEQLPKFTRQDVFSIEDDIEVRKKWVLLLMLGSFHTMGRTNHGQHRNFIKLCIDKKWLDRFADPKASPDSLLSILDEYLADPYARSWYYQWMKQFISFYQISKWLTTYVISIGDFAKRNGPFSLETVFNIRRDSGMTGTGLDAPPLDRGLGIGACFVVRELLRCGFFDNPWAYEHAFVPRRAIRSVLTKLGAPLTDDDSKPTMSTEIFRFLRDNLADDKAHFHKSFDIPFAVLAKHPDLLTEIPDIEQSLFEESPVEYLDD